jgi:hypothetical protein
VQDVKKMYSDAMKKMEEEAAAAAGADADPAAPSPASSGAATPTTRSNSSSRSNSPAGGEEAPTNPDASSSSSSASSSAKRRVWELVEKRSMKERFGVPSVKRDGTLGRVLSLPPMQVLQLGEEFRAEWVDYSAQDAKVRGGQRKRGREGPGLGVRVQGVGLMVWGGVGGLLCTRCQGVRGLEV